MATRSGECHMDVEPFAIPLVPTQDLAALEKQMGSMLFNLHNNLQKAGRAGPRCSVVEFRPGVLHVVRHPQQGAFISLPQLPVMSCNHLDTCLRYILCDWNIDGAQLATALDAVLLVYDVISGALLQTLAVHQVSIRSQIAWHQEIPFTCLAIS